MLTTDPNGVITVDTEALKSKLNEDGGADAVVEEFKKIKGYTPEQFSSVLNNFTKDAKERWRDESYPEIQRDILGSTEKRLKEEFGLENLEGGKDYKKTADLIKIIIDKNKGDGAGDDKEKEEMRQKIKELSEKNADMIPKGELTKLKNSIFERILDTEINHYADKVDVDQEKVQSQLSFLKYEFTQRGFKIGEKDGKEVVLDKSGEIVKDEAFNYKTPAQVVSSIAQEVLTLKQGHAGGRGGNPKPKTPSALAEFTNRQELNDHMKSKGIDPLSRDGIAMIAEWQKLQPA